ncbi:MAG TPA: efflux RND transporter permease subunit [Mariprofundaceae bacterium]|nr:efflux RND transporter permease subunit [Mariprofundaceae bacterium]
MSFDPNKLNIAGRLSWKATHSQITPIASAVIFLIGLVALFVTPREENPQIDVPAANVFVRMPGATPEEVHNLIVRPLEMVLREMPGVDHTFGTAMDSMGVVTVQFDVGQDKEASLVKLYDRIMHSLDRIPPGASRPLIKPLDVDDVPIVVLTLSSADYSDMQLKQLAMRVKEQLAPIPGVSVADVVGGRDMQVTVNIDPGRMAAQGIGIEAIQQALDAANVALPAGAAVDNNMVKKIHVGGFLRSADDVANLVLAVHKGRIIYLRDVATVTEGPGEIDEVHRVGFGPAEKDRPKGEYETAAVSISLAKKRGTNAVVVAEHILQKLDTLKGDLIPDDVHVNVSRDSGEQANDAVNTLVEHLGIAIGTVIIILLLFLGWREAAIVTMNIPLVLLIVLAVGLIFGQTINRITLFALILSLGLLVDDSIVVIENVHRYFSAGIRQAGDKAIACVKAANETGKPTIVATFAVILAFIPMAFVTGMMGPYMAPIPFNAPVAMLASLVIAYMLTPWVARRFMHCKVDTGAGEVTESHDWLARVYLKYAEPLIERPKVRKIFFAVTAVLMIFALWEPAWQFFRPAGINGPMTPGTVELKMLPKGNKNTFNITIDMPAGTTLETTDAVSRDIGEVLHNYAPVTDYETYVGMAGPVDFNGMLRGASVKRGPNVAEIRVNLVSKHERSEKSEQIVLGLRKLLEPVEKRYPGANIKLVEDPPGPPVRATLLAEIYGPDYHVLRQIAKQVRNRFEHTWDVVDVDDSVSADQQEYRLVVNKEKAAASGVTTMQVAKVIHDFVSGFDIGSIHVDSARDPVLIHVQIPRKDRIAPRDLDRIHVVGRNGELIPVSTIARIEQVVADKPIYTKDGHQVVYVTGEPETGSQVYPLLDMDKHLDGDKIAPGVTLKTGGMRFTRTQPDDTFGYELLWDGEMRLTLDVFRDLGAAFIVALVLIYLLLVAYYGGFTLPLLVMGAIPLTMIGIFPGHLITGQRDHADHRGGGERLAGVVVRNSMLLIDFILGYRADGHSVKDAVMMAGAMRARPIILTALAIIAGTSIMIADPVFGGLGVSMAFGTIASTVLTMFVIPLLYYLWQREKT